jgi:hypothetical protein
MSRQVEVDPPQAGLPPQDGLKRSCHGRTVHAESVQADDRHAGPDVIAGKAHSCM